MPAKSLWCDYAESRTDAAAGREGGEKQTDAIGEGALTLDPGRTRHWILRI